jgi:hypothetical protein
VVEGANQFTKLCMVLLDLYLSAEFIHPVLFVGIHVRPIRLETNCYGKSFRRSGSK